MEEGNDFDDSMDETPDASTPTTGQPKIYHRWTVKDYWQDKHKHNLPDGWCEIFHTSGFPLYFHKQTRVVTLSRPYFLGSVSVRHHLIPVASIPCLYMKRLQDESKSNEEDIEEGEISSPCPFKSESNPQPTRPSKPQQLPVSLQILSNSTLDDALRFSTLTSDELRSYCQQKFAFEQREFKFFPSLGDKWKYIRQAQIKRREQNTPADAQIIELQPLAPNEQSVVVSTSLKTSEIPIQTTNSDKKLTIDLYPSKSPIALLQEYALKRMKLPVKYDWFTTDVSNSPFGCRILVGDNVYGTGIGRNKRTAKLNATEESLVILVPGYKKLHEQKQQKPVAAAPVEEEGAIDDDDEETTTTTTTNTQTINDQQSMSSTLLDEYAVSDENIYDVCVALGKPTPYQMLEKSLTYNALTRGESNINLTMTKKPMFTHITLEIGSEHREEAQAKDKAHAKNLAAQKLLKKLHPHLHTYGSLIRLYEKNADTYKRVRVDDELADIVRSAKKNEPNHALLAKLREEMFKLKSNQTATFDQYAIHIIDVNDQLLGRSTTTNSNE